jgi:pSer/pThr/pTyr-binding forkhead associated (FHA) protein
VSTYWLKYRGTRFPLRRGETLLGRSPYCSIVLSNPLASRQHCALSLKDGRLSIDDLGSSNGTWVNGERIEHSRSLGPGDTVRVGTDVLEVILAEERGQRLVENTSHDRARTPCSVEARDLPTADPSATTSHGTTLELLEQLVAGVSDTQRPATLASSIQRVVEAVLEQADRLNQPLDNASATRVAAVVEKVSTWFRNDELAGWRARMLGALQPGSS